MINVCNSWKYTSHPSRLASIYVEAALNRNISEIEEMRLEAVLLSLLLSEASAAPRKKRDIGAEEIEHPRHAVSFFDSFFSFFGGGSDPSQILSTQVH